MSRAGAWNKAIRFYPDMWAKEIRELSRFEADLLFSICVFEWKDRKPVNESLVRMGLHDCPDGGAMIDGLIARKFLYRTDQGIGTRFVKRSTKRPDERRLPAHVWKVTRKRIFERDNHTCRYCGARDVPLECDHVTPVSQGGSNDDNNLAASCKPCNRSKAGLLISEWKQL